MSPDGSEKDSGEKFCSNCGEVIDEKAELCPECGVRLTEPDADEEDSEDESDSDDHDPRIALIASAVLPGAGQVYNGEVAKGAVFHVSAWIATVVGVVFLWLLVPIVLPLAVWAFGVYDAYDTAQKIDSGETSA